MARGYDRTTSGRGGGGGGTTTTSSGVPLPGLFGSQMIPATTNSTVYGNPGSGTAGLGTGGGQMTYTSQVATIDASEISLAYGNHYVQQSIPGEVDGPNAITVRASLIYPYGIMKSNAISAYSAGTTYAANEMVTLAGNLYMSIAGGNLNNSPLAGGTAFWAQCYVYPLHFEGESTTRDVTIQPGVIARTIRVAVDVTKGTRVGVATMVQTPSNSGFWPLGPNANPAYDWIGAAAAASAVPTDYTTAFPTGVASQAQANVYGPLVVMGYPKNGIGSVPSVAFYGDSITDGSGDTTITLYGNEKGGWPVRGLSAVSSGLVSYFRSAKSGDKAQFYAGSGSAKRKLFSDGATHAVVALGTNDIASVADLATMQARLLAIWTALANKGIKVYAATVPPQTTSTDSWATVGNQTAATNFGAGGIREQLNAWIKTTPTPLTGYVDIASALQDSTTTWAWKANFTGDGTHPTSTGHAAAAAVATTVFSGFAAPGGPLVGPQGPQGIQGIQGATGAQGTNGSGVTLTTKGDLQGFDTAGVRVPVGTDDTALLADSSASAGLTYAVPSHAWSAYYKPAGVISESIPWPLAVTNATGFTSGTLFLVPISLPKGKLISSISFFAGGTGAATPTNQWFGLFDSSRNLLAVTADDTTTAWAAFAKKTLALASAYTTTYRGLHYIGVMVAAGTMPSLAGTTPYNANAFALGGNSNATQTSPQTPGSFTANAPSTTLKAVPYAYVS